MVNSLGQTAEHDAEHDEMNPSFGTLGFDFVIANQATMFHEPAKGSLDDPSFGKDEKAPGVDSGDNLQAQGTAPTVRGHPSLKFFSLVALVGPDASQPTEPLERCGQETGCTRPLGHIGRSDADPQQQAQGVDQHVTLASLGFLGGIVAALSGMIGGANRLAVENGGSGLSPFAGLAPDKSPQSFIEQRPKTAFAPSLEIATSRLPRAKVFGEQAPGSARPGHIKQRVDDFAPVRGRPPTLLRSWQKRLKQFPLLIGQVCGVRAFSHPPCFQRG